MTTTKSAALKSALKSAGFNSRQVSVRHDQYSMGSTLYVTIRDINVPLRAVKAIAGAFEVVRHCESSGEILGGGNTHLHVKYDDKVIKPWALEIVVPQLVGIAAGECRTVQVLGESIRVALVLNSPTWNSSISALDYQCEPELRTACYLDPKDASNPAQLTHFASQLVELAIELADRAAKSEAAASHDVEQPIPVLAPSNCRPLPPFPRPSSGDSRATEPALEVACQVEDWAAGL